jgi:hypothetical protein
MSHASEVDEEVWCEAQRAQVAEYLAREGLVHGGVGDWPAWHVRPYVALWAVESVTNPGWVGWWAISGDLPTDYTSCGSERHPREGLSDIASRWKQAADSWRQNKPIEGWSIGAPDDWSTLAPLLEARSGLLLSFVADDALWNS